MEWFVLAQVVALILDVLALFRQSEREKDLEILLLRQQLRIVERKQRRPPRLSPWEKLSWLCQESDHEWLDRKK
jgi:hypothetical protein